MTYRRFLGFFIILFTFFTYGGEDMERNHEHRLLLKEIRLGEFTPSVRKYVKPWVKEAMFPSIILGLLKDVPPEDRQGVSGYAKQHFLLLNEIGLGEFTPSVRKHARTWIKKGVHYSDIGLILNVLKGTRPEYFQSLKANAQLWIKEEMEALEIADILGALKYISPEDHESVNARAQPWVREGMQSFEIAGILNVLRHIPREGREVVSREALSFVIEGLPPERRSNLLYAVAAAYLRGNFNIRIAETRERMMAAQRDGRLTSDNYINYVTTFLEGQEPRANQNIDVVGQEVLIGERVRLRREYHQFTQNEKTRDLVTQFLPSPETVHEAFNEASQDLKQRMFFLIDNTKSSSDLMCLVNALLGHGMLMENRDAEVIAAIKAVHPDVKDILEQLIGANRMSIPRHGISSPFSYAHYRLEGMPAVRQLFVLLHRIANHNASKEALSEAGIKERIVRIQNSLKEGSPIHHADDQRVVLSLKGQALNVYSFIHNWLTRFLSVPNYGDRPDDAQKEQIQQATQRFKDFQAGCARDEELNWVSDQSNVGLLLAMDAQKKNILVNRIAQLLQGGDESIPVSLLRLIKGSLKKDYTHFVDSMKSGSDVYTHFIELEKEEAVGRRIRRLILEDLRNINRPMIEALMMGQRGHNGVGELQLLGAQNIPSCAEGLYLRFIEGILVTQKEEASIASPPPVASGIMNLVVPCGLY